MQVDVHWTTIAGDDDEAWDWTRVLYGYKYRGELIYVGKAYGATSSVEKRWNADDKQGLFIALEDNRGIRREQLTVIVGDIVLDDGERLTRQLLGDVETLLIIRLKPWGNISATQSRTARPGMRVRCFGRGWPYRRRSFIDR